MKTVYIRCEHCEEGLTYTEWKTGYCVRSGDSYHHVSEISDIIVLEDEENERSMPDLQYPSERSAFTVAEW